MKRLLTLLLTAGVAAVLVSFCGMPQWAQDAIKRGQAVADAAKTDTTATLADAKDAAASATADLQVPEVNAPEAAKVAEAEPAPAAAPAAEPAAETLAVATGITSFYGLGEPATGKPWAAEAVMNPDYVVAEAPAAAPAAEAAAAPVAAEETAAAVVPGVTSFYGLGEPSTGKPWAAEATMNPDYAAAEAPAAPPAAETTTAPAAPEEAVTAPVPGVTQFYGMGEPSTGKAWAAEATMNPDYSTAAAAPAEAIPPPVAEAEAPPAPTVPGVTSFYGTGEPSSGKPWSAEATMNPDYSAAAPVTTAAADPSPAAQGNIESCRDALNGEAKAGQLRFAVGKYDILPSSYGTLDKIAKVAKDCNGLKIEVGGHTDSSGTDQTNQTISELRAQAVVKYLTKAGVDGSVLSAVGYGEGKPVAPNDTPAGRRENRRTEFLVTQ
jgi:outer membrane protein OmpA-like peptidoglycan-associated protein